MHLFFLLGNLIVTQPLDIDGGITQYDFKVEVSDGTHKVEAPVTVKLSDLNDITPIFKESNPVSLIVSSIAAVGDEIDTLTAMDGDYSKPNNEFEFFIDSGNDNGFFAIGLVCQLVFVFF